MLNLQHENNKHGMPSFYCCLLKIGNTMLYNNLPIKQRNAYEHKMFTINYILYLMVAKNIYNIFHSSGKFKIKIKVYTNSHWPRERQITIASVVFDMKYKCTVLIY